MKSILALAAVLAATAMAPAANASPADPSGAYRPGAVRLDGAYRGGSLTPNPRVSWSIGKPRPKNRPQLSAS